MANQKIFGTAPFFLVPDIYAAADYYEKVLGFPHGGFWGDPVSFCIPTRDEQSIMLKQVKDPSLIKPNHTASEGAWDAYFWVRDAQSLYEEMVGNGAEIEYGPMIREGYDMKEFAIKDLNGYVLAFGQHWENASNTE